MSKKEIERVSRQVAHLDGDDQLKIIRSSDEELPRVLQELGVSIPSTSWWTVALKVILYALGLILAGIGTVSCSNLI